MKIIISDYDGTLYTDKDDIEKNAKRIENYRNHGNLFIISTARNFSSIKDVCIENNIMVDYFFCDIGATILDYNGKILYSQYIAEKHREKIEYYLEKYLSILTIDRYGTHGKIEREEKEVVEYKIKGDMNTLLDIKKVINQEIPNVKTQITEDYKLIIHTSTKETAIEEFILKFGIDKDNIYTVGDEVDDLGMLKKYNGYRMRHCNPIVKEQINKSVSSVSELIDIVNK